MKKKHSKALLTIVCAAMLCATIWEPADLSNPSVQGSVASAGGKMIGLDGTATYGAFRTTGDTTAACAGSRTAGG